MPAYVVVHRYRDRVDNERLDLVAGQRVELAESVAAKVERNSPGTLRLEGAPEVAEVPPVVEPATVEPAPVPDASDVDDDARASDVDEADEPTPADDAATEATDANDAQAPSVEPKRRGRPPKAR